MKLSQIILELFSQLLGIICQHAILWLWVLVTKFVYVLIGVVFGWVTGWFFGGIILSILADIGITGYEMWQIGAFLGFVGSFFGSTTNFNNTIKQKEQPNHLPHNYPHH